MTFDEVDQAFYERRAEQERERAAAATDISAVRVHQEMAQEYQRKAAAIAKRASA